MSTNSPDAGGDEIDLVAVARDAQADVLAHERSAARRLFLTLPWTFDNALRIARAFVDETGDVPYDVLDSFVRNTDQGHEIQHAITELRRVHFASLGKPVPKYGNTRE